MAANAPDINAALTRKVKSLTPEAKIVFQKTYNKAPLMLALLQFLENRVDEKFKTAEAVLALYKVKNSQPDYLVYKNRFFKLRKKFYDHFQNTSAVKSDEVFTQHEILLQEAKSLIINGNYQEAAKHLTQLEEKLWRDNVFELLPETLDLVLNNHQLLRRTQDNEEVYLRQRKAIALQSDLFTAKLMAREIFDINNLYGIKKANSLFLKLQRLSINRKEYPRFKLIYNLISATCKLSGGGLDFKPDFKITARFISSLQKINTLHPYMPDYNYMAGYTHTQQYRFKYLAVMNYYAASQFKDAGNVMREIYDLVMADDSPLKRMRGPFQFNAFCTAFVAAERFTEALESANHYLHYARETNREDELLKAYIEIANVHVWMYPLKSGYTDLFIEQKIDAFVRMVSKKEHSAYYTGLGNWMKIKLMLVKGEYGNAQKFYAKNNLSGYFTDAALNTETKKTLDLLDDMHQHKADRKKIGEQLANLRNRKLKTIMPPDFQNFRFLEKILELKLKELKL